MLQQEFLPNLSFSEAKFKSIFAMLNRHIVVSFLEIVILGVVDRTSSRYDDWELKMQILLL